MAAFAKPRGDIIVGGTPITASSEIPGSDLAYQRVYRDGPMYAPVTGCLSQAQGATFLEGVHGDLLSGEDVRLTSNPLDALTGRKPRGGDVVTTIDPISRSEIAGGRLGAPIAKSVFQAVLDRCLVRLTTVPGQHPGAPRPLAEKGRTVTRKSTDAQPPEQTSADPAPDDGLQGPEEHTAGRQRPPRFMNRKPPTRASQRSPTFLGRYRTTLGSRSPRRFLSRNRTTPLNLKPSTLSSRNRAAASGWRRA
ncbi:hypothetical protein ACIGPN_28630 [Streptomyces afghaniensis]|uniref:hypothetical protein n=1 Tax=Streptomyces afghaniensis TaxID=66865 RepID=UPI0037CF546B